jgi:hypothetical protein
MIFWVGSRGAQPQTVPVLSFMGWKQLLYLFSLKIHLTLGKN